MGLVNKLQQWIPHNLSEFDRSRRAENRSNPSQRNSTLMASTNSPIDGEESSMQMVIT